MTGDRAFPIVLAHGIARIDVLRELLIGRLGLPEDDISDHFHYFRGIRSFLISHGFTIHPTSVSFAGRVDQRAKQLSDQIDQITRTEQCEKVHIIAHSMGGLDARHMIVDIPGMSDKVASLTTLGTPHLGTSFADKALSLGGRILIGALDSFLELEGFEDLTTAACKEFNERAKDHEATNPVIYQTYASSQDRESVFFPFQISWEVINRLEGMSDGLVSITSQRWVSELIGGDGSRKEIGQHEFPVPADHLNEIGWWDLGELNSSIGMADIRQQVEEYESRIKNVYLDIVRGL